MRHRIILLLALCVCSACQQDDAAFERNKLLFTGNQYLFNEVHTSASGPSFLPEGSQLLINMTGGATLSNKVLTYKGTQWNCDEPLYRSSNEHPLHFTAIHPVLQTYEHTDLYEDSKLKDILYTQQSVHADHAIQLDLKHLFSKLTFVVDESLRQGLEQIQIKVSKRVKQIHIDASQIAPEIEDHELTIQQVCNNESQYSFIIPPSADVHITLTLKYQGKTSTHTIEQTVYEASHAYQCNVKKQENRIGISNVEDLLTFAHLYVGSSSYKGDKTLADFGTTENGTTTYRLLNDIEFTSNEKEKFIGIGNVEIPFQDIFDGQGYTIKNLSPSIYRNQKYKGLFQYIGENGCVKNLSLKNAQFVKYEQDANLGILTEVNKGLLFNCSVDNATLSNKKKLNNRYIGIIAAFSNGNIINCSVTNSSLASNAIIGGICGQANGNIVNSYVANTVINNNSDYHGGICAIGNNTLNISNCYAKVISTNAQKVLYSFVNLPYGAHLNNCFYHRFNDLTTSVGDGTVQKQNVKSFNQDFRGTFDPSIKIIDELNKWVDSHANQIPSLSHWKETNQENIPAIFLK